MGYDFIIQHKSDKDNIATDALSQSFLLAQSQPHHQWLDTL